MTITVDIDENGKTYIKTENDPRIVRPKKKQSTIAFPDDFCVIDTETTGLSPQYDEIIELAAIKVISNQVVDKFDMLVKPQYEIDEFIESLTGITNEMVNDAPTIETALPLFLDFIGDSYLVGHNANFDINFLYDNKDRILHEPLTNNFVDTMRISKMLMPDLKHHRLIDMIKVYDLHSIHMHRACSDVVTTLEAYYKMKFGIQEQFGSLDDFVKSNIKPHFHVNANDIKPEKTEFDTSNPLYGKLCVFTGTLSKMVRQEAMQLVVDLGGEVGNTVTKDTDYLILGNLDYSKVKGNKSSKMIKAEKYKLKGLPIEIMPEDVFYDLVFDN